jgi:PAS domain S-box-containing protein
MPADLPIYVSPRIIGSVFVPPLIHIVDDDAQVRAATSYLLASHGYATEMYAGGAELLGEPRLDRGCILLDLRMPGMDGHAVQRELVRRGSALPVIVMSAHGDLTAAVEAMKLGAVEFLQKPPSEEALLAAVHRGIETFDRGADRRQAKAAAEARLACLSPRELQILQGLLAGLSNKAIARRLGLSPRTVEMHRANMMGDLGLSSLPEALRLAIDAELAPLDETSAGPAGSGAAALHPAPALPDAQEATRRHYEERLRLVLEASADGAWDWDLSSGRMVLSSSLVDRLGYVPEAVPDRLDRFEALLHPDDRAEFRRTLEAHLEGRSDSYACTYRIRTSDGRWRWTHVRGRVVERDSSDAPLRMVGTASDITEQREEEERARAASARLALAQWGAGAGAWELDLVTGALDLDPRSRDLHGLAADAPNDLRRADWEALVEREDREAALAALEQAIATGGTYRAEFRTRLADGQVRWILGLGKVVEDSSGRRRRIVGLNHDITDSKRSALELQRIQREVLNVARLGAMGVMASTLAHELAQPLTAVSNFARGIARRLHGSPLLEDGKLREAVAGAERSARLAADIVERLRRQARFEEAERQPASLSALVRETAGLALIDADSNGLRYAFDLDPAADRVSVDPVQIQQLVLNLVRNAVEALADVPVIRRRLRIATRRLGGRRIAIEVADSGPGIADGFAERLFTPFATSKAEGTGIGLALCRTIAEAHGGDILAEAAPDGGTIFRVTLAA